MRILMFLGRRAGLSALLALSLAGCYIPGGGWTLRTGADFRTRYKPGVFLEMVDTRWDEYNRVACQNTQCTPRPRNGAGTGGGAGAGTASGADSAAGSGCLFGFPVPGTLTPMPSNGPTLAPSYSSDANRNQTPGEQGNGALPNGIPPTPQYPLPPTSPPYPIPQPYPAQGPVETPTESEPGNAPRNEPSQIPGVTTSGQAYSPAPYGAWQGGGSGPALMLPAPDPVIPAYGDAGLDPQGPAEPASATSANAGLELSGYEQSVMPANSTASRGRGPRPAGRKRNSANPTSPAGANRHFSRPRL